MPRPPPEAARGYEPAALHGARLDRPAEDRDSLAHPDQPVASAACADAPAGAVVDDLQLDAVAQIPDLDPHAPAAGVLEDVRERLLDDPVRGQLDCGRKRPRLPDGAQLGLEPRVAHLGERPVELRQPGLRRERRLVAVAQDADESLHLDQRVPPDLLHGLDRLEGAARIAGEQRLRGAGLNGHHRDGRAVTSCSSRAIGARPSATTAFRSSSNRRAREPNTIPNRPGAATIVPIHGKAVAA
jgi:hypothetical protein